MRKKQQFLKLFIVLFFSTAFIFSFSHYGAIAFEKFSNADGKYSEGTTVGGMDISGKTESEAAALLEKQYLEWLKNVKFEFQYSELTVPFDPNLFYLDLETTVHSIKDGQQNQVFIDIDQVNVEEQVAIHFPQLNSEEIDINKLKTDLTAQASKFTNGAFVFNINQDYSLSNDNKDVIISEAIIKLTDVPMGLETVVEKNPEIKIAEGANFSLLEFAKNQKIEQSSVLSVIATGIYQAILPTNFSIIDRNISNVLPDYTGIGFEARVIPEKNADLVFTNPNKSAYTLELNFVNDELRVSLKGEKLLYSYKIIKKDEQQLKPKTIVQYSPLLKPGKTMVKNDGTDGIFVKVYRDIYQGQLLVKSELISEDYYPPVYRVEIHSLAGSQQRSSTPVGGQAASASNASTESNSSTVTDPNGSQTSQTTSTTQQDDNSDDDLWGKPNEQPK